MSITGATDEDGGRPTKVGRGDQRRRQRAVRGGVGARRAARPAVPPPSRPGGGGQRIDVSLLESTLAVLVNQAQNAFVGGPAPRAWATPTRTSCRTRRSARPTASSRSPSAASASGRGCARRSGCPGWPRTRGSRPTATGSSTAPTCGRSWRRGSRADRPPTGRVLDAADIPCGPINDVAAAFATPQAVAREMAVDVEHPVLGAVRQVGLPFRLSATPASIRTRPAAAGRARGGDPRGAGLRPGRRRDAAPGHLTCGGSERARAADDHLPDPAPPGRHRRSRARARGGDGARRGRRRAGGRRRPRRAPTAGRSSRRWARAPNPCRALVRAFQFLSMDQLPDFLVYERAIDDGRAVIAVRVAGPRPDRRRSGRSSSGSAPTS